MKRVLNLKEIKKTFTLEASEIKDRLKKEFNICVLGENSSFAGIKKIFHTDSTCVKYIKFPLSKEKIQTFKKFKIRVVLLGLENISVFKDTLDVFKNYKVLILITDKQNFSAKDLSFLKKYKNFKVFYFQPSRKKGSERSEGSYPQQEDISNLGFTSNEVLLKTSLSFFHHSLNLGFHFESFRRMASQRIILNQIKKDLILFPDINLPQGLIGLWLKLACIYNKELNFDERLVELFILRACSFLFEEELKKLSKETTKKTSYKIIPISLIYIVIFLVGNIAIEYFEGNLTKDKFEDTIKNIVSSLLVASRSLFVKDSRRLLTSN